MAEIAQTPDATGKSPLTAIPAEPVAYRFESFRLDLRLSCLFRNDVAVALRRKSFDVLLYLVRNRGRVVSRDELLRNVWAHLVVTDNSLAQCIKEIRDALGDEAQAFVATSARRGYAFGPAVTPVYEDGDPSVPRPAAEAGGPSRPSRPMLASVAAIAASLTVAAIWLAHAYRAAPVETSDGAPARLSVAVLPFSGPQGQEYFSSGLSADIAGALGRFPELAVASPDILAHFASVGRSPEEIRRDLKVRYLVEGSVLRSPEKLRIAVRLTDLPRGTLLWSESYESPADDVLAIQDRITTRIAGALAVKVANAEQKRAARKPPARMEAYDYALRGRERQSHLSRTAQSEARAAFERAIALDPNYGAPYVGLGRVDLSAAAMGWTDDAEAAFRHAEDAALRAIALDELDPAAHALLGRTYARTGQYDRAVETLKRAVPLNPSDPEGYAALGDALHWAGDLGGAVDALETALAMDPRRSAEDLFSLGAAYLLAGKDADAIRVLERATQRNEGNPFIYAVLAAAYADTGRTAEARSAAGEARRRDPFLDLDGFGSLFRKPEHRERFAHALKGAGL